MLSTFLQKNIMKNRLIEEFSSPLTISMKKNNVSVVSYAVIDHNEITIIDSISIDPQIKVSSSSLFQACSLSKSLTAYAILKLIAEGKLDIDASINKQCLSWQIPKNEYNHKVSIRQCLSMTSGFCYGELNASFPSYTQDQKIPTLKEILYGMKPAHNQPIKIGYPPGSQCHYSGAGYMVLQQLIEDVTHQSFSQYMRTEILVPLKMAHSTFECLLNSEIKADAIPGFHPDGQMNNRGWENIVTTASGGLWSTPSDLANFVLAITKAYLGIDNTVIPQNLAKEMLTRQEKSGFALGVVVDGEGKQLNFRKNGHNNGYHNELLMFPHTGQGIVVMTNSAAGISVINELIALIAKKFQWPPYLLSFDESCTTPNLSRATNEKPIYRQ